MENDFELKVAEPEFRAWSCLELFEFLIDMHQIPYEEEFENWRLYKNDLLRWCEEIYERQTLV